MNPKEIPNKDNRNDRYVLQNKRGNGKDMSLNDAISHLDDLLNPDRQWNDCDECYQEHIQLRNWLVELRKFRNQLN